MEGSGSFGQMLRSRIDAARIVERFQRVALGQLGEDEEPMTRTELDAGRILLGKVLPDLAAVKVDVSSREEVTREDIDAMLLAAGLEPSLVMGGALEGEALRIEDGGGTERQRAEDAGD